MSSGFVHVMTTIAIWFGTLMGVLFAKKFKNWDLFFFMLAVFVGWFVHVVIFDMIIIIFHDLLTKIYLAKFI